MATITNLINVRAPNKPPVSVSTTTALTSSAFGKLIICTGSSAYTVTLPSATGNTGKYIEFSIQTTSNALITIAPAAGTIDGQANIIYGTYEGGVFYCDGANWEIISQTLAPCTFYTLAGVTTQTIPNNTLTTITILSTIRYNVNGGSISSGVYTPVYPGKYRLNLLLTPTTFATWTSTGAQAQLTGTNSTLNSTFRPAVASTLVTSNVNGIMKFNGSTDNVTLQYLQQTGGNLSVGDNDPANIFEAVRISNY